MAHGKADLVKRIVAAIIDNVVIAFIINLVLGLALGWIPVLGGLAAGLIAAAYIGFKDALPIDQLNGSSPGKVLFKLKAVRASDGSKLDYEASLKRNAPLFVPSVIGALFGIIPILGALIGLVIAGLLGLVAYIAELVKVITDEQGIRFGDTWAGTIVIEEGAGDAQAAPPPPPPSAETEPPPPPPPSDDAPPPPPPSAATEPPPADPSDDAPKS